MLIESAFYKLPEVLTSNHAHADTYEGTLLSWFAACLLMELNGRNIPNPHEHLHIEKPYPTNPPKQRRWRADLLVNLRGAVRLDLRTASYGIRELNWIELKGFFGSTRSSSTHDKAANAGRLVRDLLRICLLPHELQGKIRQNSRYLLLVLSNAPEQSLPLGASHTARRWLDCLFSPGHGEATVRLSEENSSMRLAIGKGFRAAPDLDIAFKVLTHVFQPALLTPSPVFFGYLVRVMSFTISTPVVGDVSFDDVPGDSWPAERIERLRIVRDYVVSKMHADRDT